MRFLLLLFFVLNCSSLYSQNLQWAKVLNNPLPVINLFDDEARSIVSDAGGNVYVSGFFEGTVDFDPGPGVQNLTSAGGSDAFFAKYDALGNLLFAKVLGSSSENDVAYSIARDNLGNIYITGSFGGTIDFDTGPGVENLTSAGLNDIFIAKYDGSGNFVYAKSFGGSGYDHAYSIAVDNSYNVYVTGYFENSVDFDPGVGTQNLTSVGASDVFFARYDALGNYVYAKSFGGVSGDAGYSIAVDAGTNVYLTGYFSLTADFDPGTGTQNLTSLQRSDDGLTFTKLAFVPSKAPNGNSSLPLSYSSNDVSPYNGNNYYRLKQFDIDGKFTYSKVVLITTHKSNDITIASVFPNPVVQKLNVELFSAERKMTWMVVINSTGQMVMKREVSLLRGNNKIELPISLLIKGEYFVKLLCDDNCESGFKFVKQ